MLRLLILRHMKTGWALPGQRDIERRLNARGEADLPIILEWIREYGFTPGQIFCSPATRTRQTLEGILPAFDPLPEVTYVEGMYSGFTDEYLSVLNGEGSTQTILMIGHNPTCASLANALAGSGDAGTLETLTYKFPTGAMAVIDFDATNWADVREGSGHLAHFLMPKAYRTF